MPPTKSDRPVMNRPTAPMMPGHPVHHLQNLVLLVDGEIVRVAGRQMADSAHHAVQFVPAPLQVRHVRDLDLNVVQITRVQIAREHFRQGNDRLVVNAASRKLPCFSSTPITSNGRWPILIFFPSGDSFGNRLVATREPMTHTGRPPSASSAERKRPSATEKPPVKRYCSVVPTMVTPLALRLL